MVKIDGFVCAKACVTNNPKMAPIQVNAALVFIWLVSTDSRFELDGIPEACIWLRAADPFFASVKFLGSPSPEFKRKRLLREAIWKIAIRQARDSIAENAFRE